ncbi:MAG: protein kinase [Planctomycetales bacterium]|nr:protein kinase [Planctomycetales bacterium]MCA9167913.1 protein kinase [Planctomycetales bacterium]
MSDADESLQRLHRLFEQREEEAKRHANGGGRVDIESFLEAEAANVSDEVRERFRRQRDLLDRFQQMTTPPSPAKAPAIEDVHEFCHGRYEVLKVHDAGGLGVVYVARDKELSRQVAVKGIRPELATDRNQRGRFHREAKITGSLEHPGVVPVYGMGADDRGQPYYAMKFIEGETLTEAIKRLHPSQDLQQHDAVKKSIDLGDLLDVFIASCETIAFAHSRGVVHRDIKPDNILIGGYGEVLVVDWGLATKGDESPGELANSSRANNSADVEQQADNLFRTTAGSAGGTPLFMSPEQARSFRQGGRNEDGTRSQVGPASDIYSLGAVLYQILTGRNSVTGRSRAEVLAEILAGHIAPIRARNPEVPPALEAICLKSLAFKPEDRYASAKDLAADLRRFRKDQPVEAWPDPWYETVRRWVKEHRVLVTTSMVTLLVTTAMLIIGTVLLDSARRAERNAKLELAVANGSLEEQNVRLRRPQYVSQLRLVESLYNEGGLTEADHILDSTDEDLRGYEWHYWKNACRRPQVISVSTRNDLGHAPVTQSAISNDGTRIAAAVRNFSLLRNGYTWTIRVCDVHSRALLWEHKSDDLVTAITFLPNDTRLFVETQVTSAVDAPLSLGEGLQKLLQEADSASPRVAEAERSNRETTATDQRPSAPARVFLVLHSADGKVLETIDREKVAMFLSRASGTVVDLDEVSLARTALLMAQRVTPDESSGGRGQILYAVEVQEPSAAWADSSLQIQSRPGYRNQLVKFEQQQGDSTMPLQSFTVSLPEGIRITAAALDADTTLAATALSDATIRLWRVPAATPIAVFPTNSSNVAKLAFNTQDNRTLVWSEAVLAADDQSFYTTELPNLATTETPDGWPDAVEFNTGLTGDVRERLSDSHSAPAFHAQAIVGPARSSDGSSVAFATRAGKLRVWSLSENRQLLQKSLATSDTASHSDVPAPVEVALNHDASIVAVVSRHPIDASRALSVIDVPSGNQLWTSSEVGAPLCFVGRELYATRRSGTQSVVTLDVRTGRIGPELSLDESDAPWAKPGCLAHNAARNLLVGFPQVVDALWWRMTGDDLIFSLQLNGAELKTMRTPSPGTPRQVSQVRFSRDGTKAIVAHWKDSRAEVWDVRNWRIQALLDGHQGPVTDLAFSSDETRVATASVDGTVRVWDVQTGSSLATLHGTDDDPHGYWMVTFGDQDLEVVAFSASGIQRWNELNATK